MTTSIHRFVGVCLASALALLSGCGNGSSPPIADNDSVQPASPAVPMSDTTPPALQPGDAPATTPPATTPPATTPPATTAPASQKVLLEIDRMQGTTPVQLTQTLHGASVSLAGIYAPAGVSIRVVSDQADIPRQDKVRLADLHAMMMAARTVPTEAGEMKVHLLVVTEDEERPDTLGIMFDFGANDPNDIPREGFAVFETPHQNMAAGVVPEVLLTSAHELAHVFNLHHTDWEGTSFEQASTVEGYSFTDTVVWKLSAASIAHFKGDSCPRQLVLPGAGGMPFGLITQAHAGLHKNSPRESYDIAPDNFGAMSRGSAMTRSSAVRSRLAREGANDVTAASPLQLQLRAPKSEYVVGEPVTLTAMLTNRGNQARKVIALLDPEYRFLSVAVRRATEPQFHPYSPPVLRDARQGVMRDLAPGETLVGEARVFFSSDGWTFETPGEYEVQATFPADTESSKDLVQSEPVRLKIVAPATETATRAVRLMQRSDGRALGTQQGLYLYMGGGDHLRDAARNLRQITREVPQAPQAAGAKLAIANQTLSPTVDPLSRSKPPARIDEALRLLREARQDPGISGATLIRIQGAVIRQLEKAGRTAEARQLREEFAAEVQRRSDTRTLKRRDLE